MSLNTVYVDIGKIKIIANMKTAEKAGSWYSPRLEEKDESLGQVQELRWRMTRKAKYKAVFDVSRASSKLRLAR